MSELENKIIKKVYSHETRRTTSEVVIRSVSLVTVGFLIFIVGSLLYYALAAQGSFDLLNVFQEDSDVVRTYFWEFLATFYQDTPKPLLIALIIALIGFVTLLIMVIKNARKISHRTSALWQYWRRKK